MTLTTTPHRQLYVCGVAIVSFNLPYLSVPPSLATFAAASSATADVEAQSRSSAGSADAMSCMMSQIVGQMAAGQIVSCVASRQRKCADTTSTVPIQPALCRFTVLAISTAKI